MIRTSQRSAWHSLAAVGLVSLACGALLGCSNDGASAPEDTPMLTVVAGDGQAGVAGSRVHDPLVVQLRAASGKPLAHVAVSWTTTQGTIIPVVSQTDATGTATAVWVLGGEVGAQGASASAPGVRAAARFSARAEALVEPPPAASQLRVLTLTTYEGSGQAVHPDVITTPQGWSVERRHLVITPYPYGQAKHENPSVFSGDDGEHWSVPGGAVNPIVTPPEGSNGYLSDPDQLWVPETAEIWLYYRQVSSENVIKLTRSTNGVQWTPAVDVVHAPNHSAISPSVVRRGPRDWLMWTVNGGTDGCRGASTTVELRRSQDGLAWSAPELVSLKQGDYFAWHIDVEWIASRGEFWALYNVKTPGSCNTGAVYLATSSDGVNWTTYPSPVLTRGVISAFQDIVYRSSFEYMPGSDAVTFWFSGARSNDYGFYWAAAVERISREDLFTLIQRPPTLAMTMAPASPGAPLLDDSSAP